MEKKEKTHIQEIVTNFIQKFRILLIVLLTLIIVGVFSAVIYEEINKANINSISFLVEQLDVAKDALTLAKNDVEKKSLNADFEVIFQKALTYKGTFAEQRALFLKASISYGEKLYPDAEMNFIKCSSVKPDSYLAPLAILNAAFSAENNNDTEKAIEHLLRLVKDYDKKSAVTTRGMFNIGRLYESSSKLKEASSIYNHLIDSAADSDWAKLAHDRLIYIQSNNISN